MRVKWIAIGVLIFSEWMGACASKKPFVTQVPAHSAASPSQVVISTTPFWLAGSSTTAVSFQTSSKSHREQVVEDRTVRPSPVRPKAAPGTKSPPLPPLPPPPRWRHVPSAALQTGESFTFVIRWGLVSAGYSYLSITGTESVGMRPAYHIVSEARSNAVISSLYRVYDRNDVWLDTESLTTVRYEKRIREGQYRIDETDVMDQVNHRFYAHEYRIDKGLYEDKEGDIPSNALDVLGAFYYIRTIDLKVGQSFSMDVLNGGKVWPLKIEVKRRETVSVPAGKFDCFLVEPLLREPGIFVSKGKKLEVWITADERRMPVLMRSEVFIGHVSAELTHAKLSFSSAAKPNP